MNVPVKTKLFLAVSGATYLFKSEDTSNGQSSFGPSFAVRVGLGFGYRL